MPRSTVLLVEDNLDNRMIYRTILEHVGYAVIEAVDGEEALSQAREQIPDIILMDITIPKIDGYKVTRLLKKDEATAGIPIIALTAHVFPADEHEAREAGCDSFLTKPVEPQRVVAEVARFIRPGGA